MKEVLVTFLVLRLASQSAVGMGSLLLVQAFPTLRPLLPEFGRRIQSDPGQSIFRRSLRAAIHTENADKGHLELRLPFVASHYRGAGRPSRGSA